MEYCIELALNNIMCGCTYYVATWPIKVQGFSNQACSSLQHNAGSHIFGMSNTHDQSFLFGVTKDS